MHQGAFMGTNWTVRRKIAIPPNPARRPHPQSTNWNVQVGRGKVTTKCLWNACKALTIGLTLMFTGGVMATIGYYADQLSEAQEIRGNATVRVKNESRGFHLNNLSYAGPIVMGIGGFIVVASCVMTFEARDNAAKVVPARFRFTALQNSSPSVHKPVSRDSGRKNTGSQTTRWDHNLGLYRVPSGKSSPCGSETTNRKALTASFVQFSRALAQRQPSAESSSSQRQILSQTGSSLNRSPSAPNLTLEHSPPGSRQMSSPLKQQVVKISPKITAAKYRNSLHPMGGGCVFLSPKLLQRQALSMDNPAYGGYTPQLYRQPSRRSNASADSLEMGVNAAVNGSQASMAMDLHFPNDCPVTLRIRDRSETARRHMFVRQQPVEDNEACDHRRDSHTSCPRSPVDRSSPNYPVYGSPHIRSKHTGEVRHQVPSRRGSIVYPRASFDSGQWSHSNTGEFKCCQRRGSTKLQYSRSNTEDYGRQRESIRVNRKRRRESISKMPYTKGKDENMSEDLREGRQQSHAKVLSEVDDCENHVSEDCEKGLSPVTVHAEENYLETTDTGQNEILKSDAGYPSDFSLQNGENTIQNVDTSNKTSVEKEVKETE